MYKLTEILLNEALDDLYHSTSMFSLHRILKDNKIKMKYADADDRETRLQRGRPFYLSTSRQKVGNFARQGATSTLDGRNIDVTLQLDGRHLAHNHKVYPVDYFSGENPLDSEQEDRVVSKKNVIDPANDYITAIHILIPDAAKDIPLTKTSSAAYRSADVYESEKLANKLHIPIYFYTRIGDYMRHATSRAHTELTNDLVYKMGGEVSPVPVPRVDGAVGKELVNIWKGISPANTTNYDSILRMFKTNSFESTFSDIRRSIIIDANHHLPYLKDLAHVIRKSKSKDFKTFIEKTRDKLGFV